MSSEQRQVGLESLSIVTLVVDDVEEALDFYVDDLGFEVRSDEEYEFAGDVGRWVTVALPKDDVEIAIVTPEGGGHDEETRELLESKRGDETWWTFRTADCEATAEAFADRGIAITREVTEYPWGKEAMFADPSGNEFGLFEYTE